MSWPVRLSACRLTAANGRWLQISHPDVWELPESDPFPDAARIVRASALGPPIAVELFAARGDGPVIEVVPPDPASLFQAALRVDEGTNWTLRTGSKGGAPGPRMSGVSSLRGQSAAWDWSLLDAVGQSLVDWEGVRLPILVLDRKMPGPDRVQELEHLLVSVWTRHHALLRRLGRPTTLQLTDQGYRARAPIHTLLLLERMLRSDGVQEAWDAVAAEPHSALDIEWPTAAVERARRPTFHGARGPWTLPGGWLPGIAGGTVRDRHPMRAVDTPPNRLAVRLAVTVERLCEDILGALQRSEHAAAMSWRAVALSIHGRAMRFRTTPGLETVDPFAPLGLETPTVQMNPTCRPMVKAWTDLQRGLAPDSRIESLLVDPLKEAWDLYEYWCWFDLCDALEWVLGRVGQVAPLKTDPGDSFVGEEILQHGLVYRVHDKDRAIHLYYNQPAALKPRSPYWSYSRKFRPDLSLVVRDGNGEMVDFILFDAKYRVDVLNVDPDVDDVEKRSERRGFAKTDDLKVMHGYRDAVRAEDGRQPRWVLTLFPGTDVALFVQGRGKSLGLHALADPTLGGVGAVPCRPLVRGQPNRLREMLARILNGGPEEPTDESRVVVDPAQGSTRSTPAAG